jgi:orotidine-5'-phosphate decarboxylase
MTREELIAQIQQKRSYLCIGLDTDLEKIPTHLQSRRDAVFEFNRQIIDATADLCVAYKINTAFYEAMGLAGWEAMQRTIDHIPASILPLRMRSGVTLGIPPHSMPKLFLSA